MNKANFNGHNKKSLEMTDDIAIASEIEQMLIDVWDEFIDYYKENAPKYLESWRPKLEEKKAKKESHWICWDEYDLMFHVGRFFYKALKKKENSKFLNIEIHFEKKIDSANFKDYKFKEGLKKLKEMNMRPKVDMIIAYENKNSPFLLCAEMKCFHGVSWRDQESPIDKIRKDVEKLKAIRDCGIAKRVVFILFDDYYWFTDKNVANDIKNELKRAEEDERIRVLSYSSKAKMGSIL